MAPTLRGVLHLAAIAVRTRFAVIGSLILLLAACPSPTPPPETLGNKNGPQWIYPPEGIHPPAQHKSIAVVFIHGIFGDALDTWTSPAGTRFFDLLHQSEFGEQLDIYAFGYTSKMLEGGSLSIDEAARSLHQYLQHHRLLDYDQIVIVGHSMGG